LDRGPDPDKLFPRITKTEHYRCYGITVLPSHLQATKDAVFAAGGGSYEDGKYVKCAFQIFGFGQFLPVAEAGAVPHTGTLGTLEKVEEVRVEITCCGKDVTKAAVAALKE
jgi:hypothetical protein